MEQTFSKTITAMKTRAMFLMSLVLLSGELTAQNANAILKKMDEVLYACKDQTVKIEMVIIDRAGKESVREAETIQKGNSMRLFRFTAPAAQAGIAFLSLPGEIMYLYLPAYGKERRIASHIKNQNFAGTDFSYEDMESKLYSERYDAVSVKEEGDTYILELKPKPENKGGYPKLVVTVRKDNFYPVHVTYFDKAGKSIKELTNSRIEKKGKYWVATDFEMKDLTKGTRSRMIINEIVFDQNLSDEEFTVRKLLR